MCFYTSEYIKQPIVFNSINAFKQVAFLKVQAVGEFPQTLFPVYEGRISIISLLNFQYYDMNTVWYCNLLCRRKYHWKT